jgi:hypothetical protein
MDADTVEEFDNGEDFEITFFSVMHRGSIDNGISIFDIELTGKYFNSQSLAPRFRLEPAILGSIRY